MVVLLHNRSVLFFQRWSKVASAATMVIGILVLLGWVFDNTFLKSIKLGLGSMKVNTALCFVFTGFATLLLHTQTPSTLLVMLRRASMMLTVVISTLTLSEYAFNWNTHIDQLLIVDLQTSIANHPGRMSPITALNFLMLGIAFFMLDYFQHYRTAQLLIFIVASLSFVALMGYMYGIESLYQIAAYRSVAFHTAITFLCISQGMLFFNPNLGAMQVIVSDTAGGVLARRLIVPAIAVPPILGGLQLLGQNMGMYTATFGLALFVSANISIFTTLIMWSAVSLYRIDNARKRAEMTLRHLYADLEARVSERTAQLSTLNDQLVGEIKERDQAEAKFRALLEAAPDAIVIIDQQGLIVLVNSQMETLFGYAREDLIGQPMEMLVPERFRHHHMRHRTHYFNAPRVRGMGTDLELYGLHRDGTEFSVEISLSPVQVPAEILTAAAIRDISARKRIEATLRESEQRLAILFRNSPAGIALNRLSDGCYVDVNEGFLKMVECEREEVIGRSTAELGLITDDIRNEINQTLRENGVLRNLEVHFRTKSGDQRIFLLSLEVVEISNEACGLSLIYDITESARSRAALHASEAKLRTLFDVLPVGISILDREQRIVDTNPALEYILDISPTALLDDAYKDLHYIHPNGETFREEDFPIQRAAKEQRTIKDVEMGLVKEDGQVTWICVNAAPLDMENLGVVTAVNNITERVQMEAALSQERDLLQALMDNIPDTIYFKDTASRFTRINRAQAHVLGLGNPADAVGRIDTDFQQSPLAADFYAEEQHLLQTGTPLIDRQEYNPTADGQPRWFSATKVPMYDQNGKITGLIGISRDITERIQAEKALQQANEQLTTRVSQMAVLNELEEKLQACVTVEEVYEVTAVLAAQLFRTEVGSLAVINSSRNRVDQVATWGDPNALPDAFVMQDCWALRRGQPHVVGGEHATIICHHLKSIRPACSICIPLLAQGEALGVVSLYPGPDSTMAAFDEIQQQLLRVVADGVALALANLRLREALRQQSIRDGLTNLYNRRYMEESLDREMFRALRNNQSIGIIMVDADHFKRINDSYGHATGDAVLRQIGSFLRDRIRGDDIACRYGGEEFTLILPAATCEQTQLRAIQLRQEFKDIRLNHAGNHIDSLTLSFGVAAYPDHGATSEAVLRAADAALYRAKRAGRDQVIVAESID